MVKWIDEFKQDCKYIIGKHGKQHFYKYLGKWVWHLILNPLCILFFILKGWWLLIILWLPVSLYSTYIFINGKTIINAITKWQFDRYMKKVNK